MGHDIYLIFVMVIKNIKKNTFKQIHIEQFKCKITTKNKLKF